MRIPEGLTEEEVLKIIEKVVGALSQRKLVFGSYTLEDIQQEGRIIAITTGLEKFDMARAVIPGDVGKALEKFLRIHVISRLKNFRRDNSGRSERPVDIEKIEQWEERNRIRHNLIRPIDLHAVANEVSDKNDLVEDIHYRSMVDLIRDRLPVELRTDFLRMCDGLRLPKPRQTKVREAIAEILNEGEDETD